MAKGKKALKKIKGMAKKVNSIAKALGHADITGTAGAKLGGAVGKRLGNKELGGKIGRFIGSALGKGDYVVSSNALGRTSMNLGASVPKFGGNDESTIIEHREYIGDLISSATPGQFTLRKYTFNPGNSALFPWLSSIANNYEQYEPLGAIVAFKSTSAEFNALGQSLGTVIIASDYDIKDAVYSNKIEMENSTFAVSCKTSESMLHPIECDPKLRATRLLYNGPADSSADSRFHDLCNVQVASVGVGLANVNLGELWITYRIRLHKPQIPTNDNLNLNVEYQACDNSTNNFFAGGISFSPLYTNNLAPLVRVENVLAGVGALTFVDSQTWNKTYIAVLVTNIVAGAGPALGISCAGLDSQIQMITTYSAQAAASTGFRLQTYALFRVTRNDLSVITPQIRWTCTYTALDCFSSQYIHLTQVNPDVLA